MPAIGSELEPLDLQLSSQQGVANILTHISTVCGNRHLDIYELLGELGPAPHVPLVYASSVSRISEEEANMVCEAYVRLPSGLVDRRQLARDVAATEPCYGYDRRPLTFMPIEIALQMRVSKARVSVAEALAVASGDLGEALVAVGVYWTVDELQALVNKYTVGSSVGTTRFHDTPGSFNTKQFLRVVEHGEQPGGKIGKAIMDSGGRCGDPVVVAVSRPPMDEAEKASFLKGMTLLRRSCHRFRIMDPEALLCGPRGGLAPVSQLDRILRSDAGLCAGVSLSSSQVDLIGRAFMSADGVNVDLRRLCRALSSEGAAGFIDVLKTPRDDGVAGTGSPRPRLPSGLPPPEVLSPSNVQRVLDLLKDVVVVRGIDLASQFVPFDNYRAGTVKERDVEEVLVGANVRGKIPDDIYPDFLRLFASRSAPNFFDYRQMMVAARTGHIELGGRGNQACMRKLRGLPAGLASDDVNIRSRRICGRDL